MYELVSTKNALINKLQNSFKTEIKILSETNNKLENDVSDYCLTIQKKNNEIKTLRQCIEEFKEEIAPKLGLADKNTETQECEHEFVYLAQRLIDHKDKNDGIMLHKYMDVFYCKHCLEYKYKDETTKAR